jgi:hypothetical protein
MTNGDFVKEMQRTLQTQQEHEDLAVRNNFSSPKVSEKTVRRSWGTLVAWVEERYRTSCPSFDTCHAISPISPVNELKRNFPTTWKRTQSGRTLSDLATKPSPMLPSRFFHEEPLQRCYQAIVLFDTSFKNSVRRYDERHCEE